MNTVAIWLFPHFMKEPVKATLWYEMSATQNPRTHMEETLEFYCQVVIYLLEIDPTDDFLAEAEA